MRRSTIIALAALALVIASGTFAPSEHIAARQGARASHLVAPMGRELSLLFSQFLPIVIKHGASITNIAGGDSVAQTITVLGQYALEPTEDIWLFVLPPNHRYYPQSMNACAQEPTPKVNGRWEMRATVGVSESVGQTFQLITTVATPQASRMISETLRAWCEVDDYPGFEQLPQGVTPTHSIAVTRTAERWGPALIITADTLPGSATIGSPLDGAQVGQQETVRGPYTPNVVNAIWLLIYASNGRWYPQSYDACKGIHVHKAKGLWDVLATFGGPGNGGHPFDIVVVLADANASSALDAKQREWCKNNDYRGWLTIELPQKIAEMQRIRVYRK